MNNSAAVQGRKAETAADKKKMYKSKLKRIIKNKTLYLFILPALIYIFVFHYMPLYGIQIAFKDFRPANGIFGSQWVGFKHFIKYFNSYQFWTLLENTLSISIYQLVVGFPFPIMLAIILNYTPFTKLKKITQTATYAPYFLSLVVLVGMLFVFLSPTNGIVNIIIRSFGGKTVDFLGNPDIFRHLFVWSTIWQTIGWSSVIYIATLAGVSPELHEAAIVDGANKLQRIWHIDIPSLLPTAIILLILHSGHIMNVGFEKTFLMQTAPNLAKSEVISTYVYKIGLQGAQYSYASAIGLFNNIINFIMLILVNRISNKVTGSGLW